MTIGNLLSSALHAMLDALLCICKINSINYRVVNAWVLSQLQSCPRT